MSVLSQADAGSQGTIYSCFKWSRGLDVADLTVETLLKLTWPLHPHVTYSPFAEFTVSPLSSGHSGVRI